MCTFTDIPVFHISKGEPCRLICECSCFTLQSERKRVAARVQYFRCHRHSVVWHAVQMTHLANAGTHL